MFSFLFSKKNSIPPPPPPPNSQAFTDVSFCPIFCGFFVVVCCCFLFVCFVFLSGRMAVSLTPLLTRRKRDWVRSAWICQTNLTSGACGSVQPLPFHTRRCSRLSWAGRVSDNKGELTVQDAGTCIILFCVRGWRVLGLCRWVAW